jgi:predicted outer membrane protein
MLHRIPRSVRWTLVLALLGAVTVSVVQSWASAAPGTGGWTQTQWGPVGPADRDLLIKVRQAGLWELPTGQQAEQQATNPQVKEAGKHLAIEHAELDAQVRQVADQLGVQLPTKPSDQQVGWMNEISSSTGTDYDKVFVQRVRQAHGIVLPVISQVRVSTRNTLIRQFAETADTTVTRHIGYLEATGLVDYSALPEAPSPGLLAGGTSWMDMIVPALVFLAAAGAAIGLITSLRRSRKKDTPAKGGPTTGRDLANLHSGPIPMIPAPRRERQPVAEQHEQSEESRSRASRHSYRNTNPLPRRAASAASHRSPTRG